jgi:hypothetical protein
LIQIKIEKTVQQFRPPVMTSRRDAASRDALQSPPGRERDV